MVRHSVGTRQATVGIVRHGRTSLNIENRIRSWLDVPLDDIGFLEAQNLGAQIRDSDFRWDGIVSSDLARAVQTAREINSIAAIPLLEITHVLRPINLGELSGTDGERAHSTIMEYARNRPNELIGGGESFNSFKRRMLLGLIEILNRYHGRHLILCTHARGERLLFAWAKKDFDKSFAIDMVEFESIGKDTASFQTLTVETHAIS